MKPDLTPPRTAPYQGNQWKRTREILARSFYNQLRREGLTPNQVVELSAELIGLVSSDLPATEE